MIIDCHYHFEHRRLLTDDKFLRKMDECEVDKVALMGVINEPIPKPPESLLKIFRFSLSHIPFRFIAKLLKDKKIRHCFFSTDKSKSVNCVSISAATQQVPS